MKSRTVIVWSIVLVVTDQAVKWIISTNYQHVTVEIIPSLLDFKPILNNKSFYWLSLMNIYVGRWARMATAVIFSGILCLFYLYMKGIFRNKTCLDVAFIFGFAGMLCSLSDNIFFGGSWDYVYLKPLFVFDLKDLYLNGFAVFSTISCYQNRTETSEIKMKGIISFLKYGHTAKRPDRSHEDMAP
ncbi:MAG: signal peptidase II [Tannerellaceae bacterium]|jgi:lipoprotein signal peptidase|nr:signal peptidase II [Tannerellaceae bacterium]